MKILLVDDDQNMRSALRRFLERYGHQIAGEAYDGEVGLSLARELNPDVVVMDLKMPHMTGTEAARLLRKSHPHIDVIIHSAYDEQAFKAVATKAGAVCYIVKGEGPAQLLNLLHELENRRAEVRVPSPIAP